MILFAYKSRKQWWEGQKRQEQENIQNHGSNELSVWHSKTKNKKQPLVRKARTVEDSLLLFVPRTLYLVYV